MAKKTSLRASPAEKLERLQAAYAVAAAEGNAAGAEILRALQNAELPRTASGRKLFEKQAKRVLKKLENWTKVINELRAGMDRVHELENMRELPVPAKKVAKKSGGKKSAAKKAREPAK
ncbi:MAG: hypothetical protein JWL84_123 [Rhodospirillales bacterium]|nr:hypothetical protein [Rhodospirillales bacterium]